MIFTELKNVDLAALNKAAMLIQEYASLGYDFVETVWEKDKVENIENEALRKEIIIQMLRCDEELTKVAEEKFEEYYEQGKKC